MIAATVHLAGITYRQVWRRCGKAACRMCPHGPYWYAFEWRNGRTMSHYVGANLPYYVISESSVQAELELQGFRWQGCMVYHASDARHPVITRAGRSGAKLADASRPPAPEPAVSPQALPYSEVYVPCPRKPENPSKRAGPKS
jgi:hypothetical protein